MWRQSRARRVDATDGWRSGNGKPFELTILLETPSNGNGQETGDVLYLEIREYQKIKIDHISINIAENYANYGYAILVMTLFSKIVSWNEHRIIPCFRHHRKRPGI